MVHKFNPENWKRLESPERRAALPPEHILDEIRLQPGQTMVDVGVGSGFFAIPAAERVGSQGKIYAVDISTEMLRVVEERIEGQALPIELVRSQETRVPLGDDTADHVFVSTVFHEIPPDDRTAFLREMTRLMKSDGMLTILDWAPVEHVEMGPPSKERLPRSEVEVMLRKAHIEVVRSESLGSNFYLVQGKADR